MEASDAFINGEDGSRVARRAAWRSAGIAVEVVGGDDEGGEEEEEDARGNA